MRGSSLILGRYAMSTSLDIGARYRLWKELEMLPLEKLIPRLLNPLTAVTATCEVKLGDGRADGRGPPSTTPAFTTPTHEKVVGIGRREATVKYTARTIRTSTSRTWSRPSLTTGTV